MNKFYTSDTFDQNNYKRTGWTASLVQLKVDAELPRLIVRVATGRRFWPLFTEVLNFDSGINDKALRNIKVSLKNYTFPMVDRFVAELDHIY